METNGRTKASDCFTFPDNGRVVVDVHSMCDASIDRYKVYKVETIGDAYMVVSGLPTQIADHASQIAALSLELSTSVGDFVIEHLPNEKLRLRIGIHTGETNTIRYDMIRYDYIYVRSNADDTASLV